MDRYTGEVRTTVTKDGEEVLDTGAKLTKEWVPFRANEVVTIKGARFRVLGLQGPLDGRPGKPNLLLEPLGRREKGRTRRKGGRS